MDIEAIRNKIRALVNLRRNTLLTLNIQEISPTTVLALQSQIKKVKKVSTLDVILQTGGGNIDSAFNIVKILKRHASAINVIVPLYAKSAGTLICMIGDKILLSEISELGPLDTQILESQEGEPRGHNPL
jgi:ClpP class serine protease